MAEARGALQSELLMPGMAVGLYGGSFDPVHEGHWHVAETARKRLGLDRVWWLVSPQNPLKSFSPADYDARLDQVRAFVGRTPRHVISDFERRHDLSRTVDTITTLTKRSPQVRFVWLMGADNLRIFHRWAGWRTIAKSVAIAVVARPRQGPFATTSRAAQILAPYRVDQSSAGLTVVRGQNSWVYLTARLYVASSTALRAKA